MSDPMPSSPEHPQTTERHTMVIAIIVCAVLLFLGTAGLLYFRWATMIEPTCVLVVDGGPKLRGAEVFVDGLGLPQPHKSTIGIGDRLALPFFLEPGQYTVRVTMNGNELLKTDVILTSQDRGRRLDLTQMHVPTTLPAAPPTTVPSIMSPSLSS